MQRLSLDNFGASANILTKFFRPRDELWSTYCPPPKCVVHCNLTQVHTSRVSFRSHSRHVEAYWCAVMHRCNQ